MNIKNDRFLHQYLFIRKGVKLIDEEIMKNQQKKKNDNHQRKNITRIYEDVVVIISFSYQCKLP